MTENDDLSKSLVKLITDEHYDLLEASPDVKIELSAREISLLLKSLELSYVSIFDFMRSASLADIGQTDAANEMKDETVKKWAEGATAFQVLSGLLVRRVQGM